jgi:hypothetical protein
MKDLHHCNLIHMFGSFVDIDFKAIETNPVQNIPFKIKQEQVDFNNNDKDERDSLPPTRDGVFDKEEEARLMTVMQTSKDRIGSEKV